VIAGQGTIGLELVDQVASIGTAIIPIGGGGLASGIALALRAVRPEVRIVGVQAEGTLPTGSGFTIADGIAVT
jgi:threonine dehydratase